MITGALTRRGMLFYAAPAFALALPTIPVYLHLPALYATELGLAATGLLLLSARLFDTIADPFVGLLSDRTRSIFGRRKPWIAGGAMVAGFGLFYLLNPPNRPSASYLLANSILLYAGWTMVAVPYLAWGAELSNDYNNRTEVVAWREGAGLVGIVTAGIIVAAAVHFGLSEREAVGGLALCAIAVGAATIPVLLWALPDPPTSAFGNKRKPANTLKVLLASLGRNRPFHRLLAAWFVNGLANSIPAALFLMYLEHRMAATETLRAGLILLYFLSAIAAIPLWSALSRTHGKHRVWCWAMLSACLAFVGVPLLGPGDFVLFAFVCVVTGMALGADLALPPAIQADVVDYETMRTGDAKAGLQFSLWSMATKLALALGVGVALPLIGALGFDPSAPTPGGLQSLAVIYAFAPVVIKVFAISIMWRFPLTAKKQDIIRRRLLRRAKT